MSVIILNGFDRCGSSAISRTLSQHPQVELIFQPFNSGSVRKKMYQIWDDAVASEKDRSFFKALSVGQIDESYIESEWYYKYSTTRKIIPGRLHVIKTTINHFTAEWHNSNFPEIPMWGIWREPESILKSILRNDFTDQWYVDALESLKPVLSQRDYLKDYIRFLPHLDSVVALTAFFIAVRSHYFFFHIPIERILRYETFVESPNRELGRVCEMFDLEIFDFSTFSKRDLNVIGKAHKTSDNNDYMEVLSSDLIADIFNPLREMMCRKYSK